MGLQLGIFLGIGYFIHLQLHSSRIFPLPQVRSPAVYTLLLKHQGKPHQIQISKTQCNKSHRKIKTQLLKYDYACCARLIKHHKFYKSRFNRGILSAAHKIFRISGNTSYRVVFTLLATFFPRCSLRYT